MAQNKGPVIVTLNCEARPSTDTQEIDRAEWDAMTPAERLALIEDMSTTHMTNAGGYGWAIEDPDDEAMVGGSAPNPLRELAEWLAAQRPVVGVRPSVIAGPDARLNDAIARARQALGLEEG